MTQAMTPGSGAMFDRIARRYDLLNRVLSAGLDRGWRRRAVDALDPRPGERYLDVATGTGDVALAILARQPTAAVVGLDPSTRMLARAAAKAPGDGRLVLVPGDAQALPFAAETFDGVTIAFGIRNVPDRERGLAEMARVLRPGGRLVVLELSEPTHPLARFHVHRVVPLVGAALSGAAEYRYLQRSIAAFPPPEEFAARLEVHGLGAVRRERLTLGVAWIFTGRKAA
jgi:demethylmenaquinone methyltransferase / 2-methoxy-6-polyprenyl-1,4-benzoquinol methylase